MLDRRSCCVDTIGSVLSSKHTHRNRELQWPSCVSERERERALSAAAESLINIYPLILSSATPDATGFINASHRFHIENNPSICAGWRGPAPPNRLKLTVEVFDRHPQDDSLLLYRSIWCQVTSNISQCSPHAAWPLFLLLHFLFVSLFPVSIVQ